MSKFEQGPQRAATHPVYFENSPESYTNGLPIGNGPFGGVVFQPEDTIFEFAFTRLNLWRQRFEHAVRLPLDEVRKHCDEPGALREALKVEKHSTIEPGFKPGGRMRLYIDEFAGSRNGQMFDRHQTLDIANGEVRGGYELSLKAADYEVFVADELDVCVAHFHDTYRHAMQVGTYLPLAVRLELYRLYDPDSEIIRTGVTDDGICYIEFGFKEELRAIMAAKTAGVPWKQPVPDHSSVSIELVLDYVNDPEPMDFTIYQTLVVSEDGSGDLLAQARENLERAVEIGWQKLQQNHREFWKNFYQQSGITLANPALEALWYNSLYQYGSQARGDVAPALFGLWIAERSAPWRGDYHGDINFSMYTWPLFMLNHPEMLEGCFETYKRWFPAMRREAQKYYGVDALRFPLACGPNGECMTPGVYRMMQCSTGFYANNYIKAADWCPDEDFIRKEIFPVLEGTSKYYLHLTEERSDGSLQIGPSWSPEQGVVPAWNVANDLGLIKPLWEKLVELAQKYNIKSDIADKAAEYLQKFPAYPQKDGHFMDSDSEPDYSELCHPSYLACVVPGDDVDADSPLAGVARKTMREHLDHTIRQPLAGKIGSGCDLTWPWLFCSAVRLRDKEFAETMLLEVGIKDFVKSNGLFAHIGGRIARSVAEKRKMYDDVINGQPHSLCSQTCSVKGREAVTSMPQQAGGFMYGLMECMLQSHRRELKLFPCVLDCFGSEISFHNLVAEGGVEVSAAYQNGNAEYAVLTTGKFAYSGTIRFFDGFDAPELCFSDGSTAVRTAPGTYRLEIPANTQLVWKLRSDVQIAPAAKLHQPEIKAYFDGYPIEYGRRGTYY